jgi:hypothetical protein
MWVPWQVAAMTGAAAGVASALSQLDLGALLVLTGSTLVAGFICLITWFGLWISKRPNLALVPALSLASASAIIAFLFSMPIETHAELVDSPAVMEDHVYSMRSGYMISLVGLLLPGLIALVIGRTFGVPPNTSLERTRER